MPSGRGEVEDETPFAWLIVLGNDPKTAEKGPASLPTETVTLGTLTGTVTERRRLDLEKQIMLLTWRRNKTIYAMYTSLAGHNRPFSTVPLSPRWGKPGWCARGAGKWTVDLGVITFTVTAAVSIVAPAKRPAALAVVP